ncbi:P-loop NTPase fold protein [Halobacteriovorax sp. XZX-3]|uniref:KAP family P-loop NTPase fold protein n=1 Tax=unclassified Halobacteriovorax TaxID=2639665 RepID=UPI003711698E
MWTDNEAEVDYLNFETISKTVAEIIVQANNKPISIGVNGSWGIGKSTLIKLINKSLKAKSDSDKYIFVEFNAWLYQGYDDARASLMDTIANKLIEEAEGNADVLDKAKGLLKRVNWLRVSQFALKNALPLAFGLPPTGLIGSVLDSASKLVGDNATQKDLDGAIENVSKSVKVAQGFLNPVDERSPPKEIQEIRNEFEETLKGLDKTLIVLIDDLDRCLPDTTVSTLEAIRLFLFLPNTAFVVAADKKMIKHAVKKHFSDIDDDLVTNYFDKLIQVPIEVPYLGTQEVRAYLMSLFVEQSNILSDENKLVFVEKINEKLRSTWKGEKVDSTFASSIDEIGCDKGLTSKFVLAERLSPLLTKASKINGNPRLIKRFLNALSIRLSIAKANNIEVNEEELIKMLLFERCGDSQCYDEILKAVIHSDDGKAEFLGTLEVDAKKGELSGEKDNKWGKDFELEWLTLEPSLASSDLRGIVYLAREFAPIVTPEDQLSPEAIALLETLINISGSAKSNKAKLQKLPLSEQVVLAQKLINKAKKITDWNNLDVLEDLIVVAGFKKQIQDMIYYFLESLSPSLITPAFAAKLTRVKFVEDLLDSWKEEEHLRKPLSVLHKRKGK